MICDLLPNLIKILPRRDELLVYCFFLIYWSAGLEKVLIKIVNIFWKGNILLLLVKINFDYYLFDKIYEIRFIGLNKDLKNWNIEVF